MKPGCFAAEHQHRGAAQRFALPRRRADIPNGVTRPECAWKVNNLNLWRNDVIAHTHAIELIGHPAPSLSLRNPHLSAQNFA